MSHATTAATTRTEEPTTMNPAPDLAAHPTVRAVRADIAVTVERHAILSAGTPGAGPERVARALAQVAQALEEDPILCLDPQTRRRVDLVAELVRQLGPLTRQTALLAQAERLEQDADLTGTERRRALVRLGKLNPTAPAQAEYLAGRAEEITTELCAQAAPGRDTPERRRTLAGAHLNRRTLAEATALLRRAVRDAAAIDPDLPEVAAVLAAAEAAEQAAAPTGVACAALGCAEPLPETERAQRAEADAQQAQERAAAARETAATAQATAQAAEQRAQQAEETARAAEQARTEAKTAAATAQERERLAQEQASAAEEARAVAEAERDTAQSARAEAVEEAERLRRAVAVIEQEAAQAREEAQAQAQRADRAESERQREAQRATTAEHRLQRAEERADRADADRAAEAERARRAEDDARQAERDQAKADARAVEAVHRAQALQQRLAEYERDRNASGGQG